MGEKQVVEGLPPVPPPGYRFKKPRRRGSCGGVTSLPEGKTWVGHTGQRQQRRELKRVWRAFEKECKTSPELANVRKDLLDAVVDAVAPAQEIEACWLTVQASRVRSSMTGKRFTDVLHDAVDQLIATPHVVKSWTDASGT